MYAYNLKTQEKSVQKNILKKGEFTKVLEIIPTSDRIVGVTENSFNGLISLIFETENENMERIDITSLDPELAYLNTLITSKLYLNRYLILGGSLEVQSDREIQPIFCIFDLRKSLKIELLKTIEDTGEVISFDLIDQSLQTLNP